MLLSMISLNKFLLKKSITTKTWETSNLNRNFILKSYFQKRFIKFHKKLKID